MAWRFVGRRRQPEEIVTQVVLSAKSPFSFLYERPSLEPLKQVKLTCFPVQPPPSLSLSRLCRLTLRGFQKRHPCSLVWKQPGWQPRAWLERYSPVPMSDDRVLQSHDLLSLRAPPYPIATPPRSESAYGLSRPFTRATTDGWKQDPRQVGAWPRKPAGTARANMPSCVAHCRWRISPSAARASRPAQHNMPSG